MKDYLAFKNEEEKEKNGSVSQSSLDSFSSLKGKRFLTSGMLGTAGLLCFLILALYSPELGVLFF